MALTTYFDWKIIITDNPIINVNKGPPYFEDINGNSLPNLKL